MSWKERILYRFFMKHASHFSKPTIKWLARFYPDARIRKKYWELLGVKMGNNTFPNFGFECTSNGETMVYIGDNVSIAPNVTIICESSANNGDKINHIPKVVNELTKIEPVIIENEVWIGAGAILLPGVHIGECSIIGAGSVVIHDVEPYSIYAGVPARKIRDLKEACSYDEK